MTNRGFKGPLKRSGQGWYANEWGADQVSTEGIVVDDCYIVSEPNPINRFSRVHTVNGISIAVCFPMDSFLVRDLHFFDGKFLHEPIGILWDCTFLNTPKRLENLNSILIEFRQRGVYPTVNLFRAFYQLHFVSDSYSFTPRDHPLIQDVGSKLKDWRRRLVLIHALATGFNVNILCREPDINCLIHPHLTTDELTMYDKSSTNKIVFDASLVESLTPFLHYFEQWKKATNHATKESSSSGKRAASISLENVVNKRATIEAEAAVNKHKMLKKELLEEKEKPIVANAAYEAQLGAYKAQFAALTKENENLKAFLEEVTWQLSSRLTSLKANKY